MNNQWDLRKKTLHLTIVFLQLFSGGIRDYCVFAQEKKDQQENQSKNGKSKETAASQEEKAKSEGSAPSQKPKPGEQEEFIEVKTPFGIQRLPKKNNPMLNPASPTAPPGISPAPAATPAAASPPQTQAPPAPPSTKPAESGTHIENRGQAKEPAPATPSPAGKSPEAPPEKPREKKEASKVRLQLDHADLQQLINIIGQELKLNYIVDPKVVGTVTINTVGELRREDLLPLLETLLGMNGAAIVKTGDFYQIVPGPKAKQLPVSVEGKTSPGNEGKDQTLTLQVIPMRFVSASDMAKILTPYLSDVGSLVVHEVGNILLLTEVPANLKKLLELVDIFDADVFENKRVQVYPIKNALAKDIVTDLVNVFSAYGLSSSGSAIRFLSVDRINSILAVSPNPASYSEVEKWIAKLDRPGESSGVRNYVYKVENSEAQKIATILMQIYGKTTKTDQIPDQIPSAGAAPGSGMTHLGSSMSGGGGGHFEEKTVTVFSQGSMRIVADNVNNALIIQCSPQDYETIKDTIRMLDVVPRQVLIDARIYEVTLTGALSLGVSYFLQQRTTTPKTTLASFTATGDANHSKGLSISTGTLIGETRELLAYLNAQESRSRTRVLSAPSVIASDNLPARIQVGTEVPLLTSQGVVPGGSVGGTSLFSNTISNRPTGVILSVTPRINASGWVTLKLNQEVSSPVAPDAGSAIQSPSISVRSVDTQLTVKDGETIAIGGIISENKLYSKNRVPLVGDIPGLGLLFGNTSSTTTRTELIVLITPHVVQDLDTASEVSDELKSKLKGLKKELRQEEEH
ncbi:MAG TPA: type II secretion system secretin GspD [Terriglobia bacterium]|nr:type II secretion system secretin GspD [Terriglobia bacterium]